MNRNKLLFAAMLLFVLSLSSFAYTAPAQPGVDWDFPRIEHYNMVLSYPWTKSLEDAKSCVIDNFVGVVQTTVVDTLTADPYYWNVSMNPGFHMCYIGPNCRDYTPESSGMYWDYHGRTPGFPLYPLNVSQFRMALEVIVADFKGTWLSNIFKYINVRIDQVIPPANSFWFNPCISPYPGSWTTAENILLGAGFTWDKGPDGIGHTADDKWVCPNGMVLWDGTRTTYPKSDRYAGYWTGPGEDRYGFFVMPPGTGLAPTSYQITMNHVDKWNLFFCGVEDHPSGATTDHLLFMDDAADSYDRLLAVPFDNRDHDLYFLCWGLGRNPDYLYDFFDPDVDVEGGDNSPGLYHYGLHLLLKTIKFWTMYDYEILKANAGPPCPPTVSVAFNEVFTIGPVSRPAPVKELLIERVDLAKGVYDEYIPVGSRKVVGDLGSGTPPAWFRYDGKVDGKDLALFLQRMKGQGPTYEEQPFTWSQDTEGNWWLTVKFLSEPKTLNRGDALEVRFYENSYARPFANIDQMQLVVYMAQWKLYYLVPYLPIYSRNYINLYKAIDAEDKWVEGWVDSTGFGSEPTGATMPWTTNNVRWSDNLVGGTYKYHLSGGVSTLNPFKVRWVYEAYPSGRLYDVLYAIDPYTHADIPWVAYKWEIEPWNDGQVITFYLRNDVYWQDGDHVTAEDIAWNFDFIESITAPEQQFIWLYLDHTEIVNDYCIKLYVNTWGYWKFLEMAGSALTFPRQVWEPYLGDYNPETSADYTAASTWKLWEEEYQPGLTKLFGTGPYKFVQWDKLTGQGIIYMDKRSDYWARTTIFASGVSGLLWHVSEPAPFEVQFLNVNAESPITFTWEFKVDGNTVGSGTEELDPFQYVNYGPYDGTSYELYINGNLIASGP